MPSPYVVAFLFAGCREIHRIGGHVLDRSVLELFAWELLEKVSFFGHHATASVHRSPFSEIFQSVFFTLYSKNARWNIGGLLMEFACFLKGHYFNGEVLDKYNFPD